MMSHIIVFVQECHLFASVISSMEMRGLCLCSSMSRSWAGPEHDVCQWSDSVWGLASETDQILTDSSPAFTEAWSEAQGVVSLAHALLFGRLWQQDPNNLDMCLCIYI